jgi:uncharacterized protein
MADANPPLTDAEMAELEERLDALPAPLEPLDLSMLDGYLAGVLLQPKPVAEADWWPTVLDVDGRAAPARLNLAPLQALVRRRHAELNRAIHGRQWFDPWVFELDEDAEPLETVMPWVAGFATAMELFPALMRQDSPELLEPLAVLYRAFDPDDLEDADDLLAAIEELEPPGDLAEAVESLVNSTLLLADVSRPQSAPAARPRSPAGRRGTPAVEGRRSEPAPAAGRRPDPRSASGQPGTRRPAAPRPGGRSGPKR